MPSVHYFYENVNFKLSKPLSTNRWIKEVIKLEKGKLDSLNFIFCSDAYLFEINKEYLNHKTYTDIITFDNSEDSGSLNGDIFISIERVKENAHKLKIHFEDELRRVMVHGVLHLLGHNDKTNREKRLMRKREDAYLSLP